ncbi:remodeling and spacing factor 1 [Microcaecilia unicolor]|uniref:Remodeling and spacing factor 1 n=1 Tax=Microcaecilia unicolor TaxID=1415580 RepID=A0A6P7XTV4_9AMPH|nr:remodeling and spacing factor 1 [Microcaecilia unicolor]
MAVASAAATAQFPGSWPDFAVVCSFLERYGALLDLPELTFPELERVLQESSTVPKQLVELHLKLMRKIGKSVTVDRWEKYLIKICQDYNSTWAWEMEKKGYQEMTVECKLGILKHLCECQFDDNLKFKNTINEEDSDAMRLQPIGRDKDGVMYWCQLDQDHNIRMYIEEQDDQDGSSWKCVVKNRNELAEILELLKAQIDPALLKKPDQQDNSSHGSSNHEEEEIKKEEEKPLQVDGEKHIREENEDGQVKEEIASGQVKKEDAVGQGKEENKIKEENAVGQGKEEKTEGQLTPDEIKTEQSKELNVTPTSLDEGKNTLKNETEEKEFSKTIVKIKIGRTSENDEKKIAKEENDSFKENVKPVKTESKEDKVEIKGLREVKINTDKITVQEIERSETRVIVKPSQDIIEKTEETEKLKNDHQAKIPLKKREIKLTEDYDGPIKGSFGKSVTPTKDMLREEGKQEDESLKRIPTNSASGADGKHLMNGEINSEKITLKGKAEPSETISSSTKGGNVGLYKKENGIAEEKVNLETDKSIVGEKLSSSTNTHSVGGKISLDVNKSVDNGNTEKDMLLEIKDMTSINSEKSNKAPSKEETHFREKNKSAGNATSEREQLPVRTGLCVSKESKMNSPSEIQDGEQVPHKESLEKSSMTLLPCYKPLESSAVDEHGLKSNCQSGNKLEVIQNKCKSEKKPDAPEAAEASVESFPIPPASDKSAVEREATDSKNKSFSENNALEKIDPEKTGEKSEVIAEEGSAKVSDEEATKEAAVLPRSKVKFKLIEEENSVTESKEITSERQKDGIKLTIRISNRKKIPEVAQKSQNTKTKEEPDDAQTEITISREAEASIGRTLRRSPRISRPTPKVAEIMEQKSEKRRNEEEEKLNAQKLEKKEDETIPEKESFAKEKQTKSKRRSRARWTSSRSRRRRRSSSEDERENSDSEESSEEDSREEEEKEEAPAEDDEPCKKCGLPNHPELILLCDSCDSGYHTACLRPPLMLIPDGEWFCPPCQHKLLCEKLEEQLQNLDVVLKKKERAERRKERLVYVGISIENIIPPQEPEIPETQEEKKSSKKPKLLERRSTRTRKCISYRFDEFDEAIDEAIEDDIRESEGGGGGGGGGGGRGKDMSNITGHRGKDISTILEEERKENKRPQRAATRRKKRRRLNDLDSDSNIDEGESEDEFRISEGSQDEFVVSDENLDDSEDQQSIDDSDVDFGTRRPRRHYARPMRQSRRLRRRTVRRRYSDDDEEEDDSDETQEGSESNPSSDYSDDYLDTRRRRSRRNQKRQINYREDSESDGSQKSVHFGRGKEMRRVRKRRLSSSDSNGSYLSRDSEDDKPRKGIKQSLRKRVRSSDDDVSEEEERPVRKRLNRIETDEEDEEEEEEKETVKGKEELPENPASLDKSSAPLTQLGSTKKTCYPMESDEEDDFDNVGKVESPLDYSLVDLPSTNGQSPEKTLENLIGKPGEKIQVPKDSTTNSSLAPIGTNSGQEAIGPEEDEDELLRVTDLVDYVCNSEQL